MFKSLCVKCSVGKTNIALPPLSSHQVKDTITCNCWVQWAQPFIHCLFGASRPASAWVLCFCLDLNANRSWRDGCLRPCEPNMSSHVQNCKKSQWNNELDGILVCFANKLLPLPSFHPPTSTDYPALQATSVLFSLFVLTGPVFQSASDFLPIAVIHQHLKTIAWISTSCCY